MTSRTVYHLSHAVQRFRLVLDWYPVDHPDRGAAFTILRSRILETIFKTIFKTSIPIPLLPSSMKPLHCARRVTPIAHHPSTILLKHLTGATARSLPPSTSTNPCSCATCYCPSIQRAPTFVSWGKTVRSAM
ncbi:hypothetical protein BDR07DRAFT_965402 [Suillus spraguei]|nr:hypothetical protein BDR07DRAFT_965402 [Suillus spraguei]